MTKIVWKNNAAATQILREINFCEFEKTQNFLF